MSRRKRRSRPPEPRPRVWVILAGLVVIFGSGLAFYRVAFRVRPGAATQPAASALSALAQRSAAAIRARGRDARDAALHADYVRALADAGRPTDAARFAAEWLAEHPDDVVFLPLGATLAEQVGDFAGALAYLARIAERSPSTEVSLRRARLLWRADALDEARRVIASMLETEPSHYAARMLLADVEAAAGAFAKAYDAIAPLLGEAPGDLELAARAARCLAEMGEFDKLLLALGEPAARPDASDELRFHYAIALSQARRFQAAADMLADLLESNPFYTRAYAQLAQACRRLNHTDAAAGFAETFTQLGRYDGDKSKARRADAAGHFATAALTRATMYAQTGRLTQATRAFRRAVRLEPRDPDAHRRLAAHWMIVERPDRAEQTLRQALERKEAPTAEFLFLLAQTLARQQRYAEAEHAYEQVLEIDPSVIDAALGVAELAIEHTHQPDRARQALRAFEAAEAADWRVAYWLGRAAMATGDVSQAGEQLALASQRSENGEARPLCWLGVALAGAGQHEAAGRSLIAAMKLDPRYAETYRALADVFTALGQAARATQARAQHDALVAAEARLDALRHALRQTRGSDGAPVYLDLGKAYLAQGRAVEALRCLTLAWQTDPSRTEAYALIAERLTAPKDYFTRAKLLHAGVRHAPDNLWFHCTLAQQYARAGLKADVARGLIATALERDAVAKTYAAAAEVFFLLGGPYADALEYAEMARQDDPDSEPLGTLVEKIKRALAQSEP